MRDENERSIRALIALLIESYEQESRGLAPWKAEQVWDNKYNREYNSLLSLLPPADF